MRLFNLNIVSLSIEKVLEIISLLNIDAMTLILKKKRNSVLVASCSAFSIKHSNYGFSSAN